MSTGLLQATLITNFFMYNKHIQFMQLALEQAIKAFQDDEVPVGAVIVSKTGDVISCGYNQTIKSSDPTAHAEILSLRNACRKVDNYRLLDTTLYVTIEPCIMCMGAMIHARISRVVFGAFDPKWGGAGSLYDFAHDLRLNHNPEVIGGVCEKECSALIKLFFKLKRKNINERFVI
jgi:tRNA(adenine34) deaminase